MAPEIVKGDRSVYIWQAMLRKYEKDISNTKEIKMNGINDI